MRTHTVHEPAQTFHIQSVQPTTIYVLNNRSSNYKSTLSRSSNLYHWSHHSDSSRRQRSITTRHPLCKLYIQECSRSRLFINLDAYGILVIHFRYSRLTEWKCIVIYGLRICPITSDHLACFLVLHRARDHASKQSRR